MENKTNTPENIQLKNIAWLSEKINQSILVLTKQDLTDLQNDLSKATEKVMSEIKVISTKTVYHDTFAIVEFNLDKEMFEDQVLKELDNINGSYLKHLKLA